MFQSVVRDDELLSKDTLSLRFRLVYRQIQCFPGLRYTTINHRDSSGTSFCRHLKENLQPSAEILAPSTLHSLMRFWKWLQLNVFYSLNASAMK